MAVFVADEQSDQPVDTDRIRRLAAHVMADRRVPDAMEVSVLCVDLERPPFAFVQVQGRAETSEDPDQMLRVATALGGRYMGSDRAGEFGRRNAVPGELLVRLRPDKVVASLDVTA